MDILQVAPYFPPYPGGQEKHVEKLSETLQRRGHNVKVLTADYPPDADRQSPSDISVYRLPVHKRVLRNPIVSPRREVVRLFRWADVVHAHNEHALTSNIAALLGSRVDAQTVLTCHGQLSFRDRASDIAESVYNRTIGAATLRAMDRVIALSESDKEYLGTLGVRSRDIDVIPNAIEPPNQPADAVVSEFEDRHDLAGRDVLLFVGPVVRRKSPETLLRAMPQIRSDHPDAVAVFVGKGAHLDTLKSEAQNRDLTDAVRFTGYLPERELLAAYQSGSVLAVPSISEGLPTTIMEGMIQGLPVVSTALDPLCDWFDDHALLVDSEPDAFATAIKKLLADDKLATALATDAAELVRSRFTWDRVASEVTALYATAAGNPVEPSRPERRPSVQTD